MPIYTQTERVKLILRFRSRVHIGYSSWVLPARNRLSAVISKSDSGVGGNREFLPFFTPDL